MKRIVFILTLFVLFFSVANAQEVIIDGTYKKNKIILKGQRLPDKSYQFRSLEYAPLSKLENEKKDLLVKQKEFEKQVKKLEKELEDCKKQNPNLSPDTKQDEEFERLRKEIAECRNNLDKISDSLKVKEDSIVTLKDELNQVKNQLIKADSLHKNEVNSLNLVIKGKDNEIHDLKLQIDVKGPNRDVINLDFLYGKTLIRNSLLEQDFWSCDKSMSLQIGVNYTHYFSDGKPFAVKVGLGLGKYSTNMSFASISDTLYGLRDDDNDPCDERRFYKNIVEEVTLSYLELPVLLHIGNSFHHSGARAWIDAGVKVAYNFSNDFKGSGTYTSEGYYPDWNVTLQDVPALGFVTNANAYDNGTSLDVKKAILWGVAAAGVHIPVGEKIGLDVGARCGYTLLPIAKYEAIENKYVKNRPNVLSGETTRIFSYGVNVGVTYNF